MSKTYYLHTLDGAPAWFDGFQVCFAVSYGRAAKLAASLRQIQREQRASISNREDAGYDNNAKLGYRRVST